MTIKKILQHHHCILICAFKKKGKAATEVCDFCTIRGLNTQTLHDLIIFLFIIEYANVIQEETYEQTLTHEETDQPYTS